MIRTLAVALMALALSAPAANAQISIGGGLVWSGGYDLGGASAQLRTNAAGATPPPFTLFHVDSRIAPAPGGEFRVGVEIGRLTVEGGASVARRQLGFSISGDPETGAQHFDGESLQHFVFDAGLLWELPVIRAPRLRTFAAGGAGYLRQLHQDRTLVQSGQVYYLGGGARLWLRGRPESNRSIGVRGDVRLNLRRHGIDFADEARIYPTLSLLMFLGL